MSGGFRGSKRWDVNTTSEWEEVKDGEENCSFHPCNNKVSYISRDFFSLLFLDGCGGFSGDAKMRLCQTCFDKHKENIKDKQKIRYILKF
jgi:hypothetical protein